MELRAKTLPHYFEDIKSGKKKFDYRHFESITFVSTETGEECTCRVESVTVLLEAEAKFYRSTHQDCNFTHNEALHEISLGERMEEKRKSNKDAWYEGWKACIRTIRDQLHVIERVHDEPKAVETVSVDDFIARRKENGSND